VCCSVVQFAQCVAVCCSVLQCVAVCCSVLQCVAVCCSVLLCVHLLLCNSSATCAAHFHKPAHAPSFPPNNQQTHCDLTASCKNASTQKKNFPTHTQVKNTTHRIVHHFPRSYPSRAVFQPATTQDFTPLNIAPFPPSPLSLPSPQAMPGTSRRKWQCRSGCSG